MARPKKQGLDFFTFDIDMFDDAKLLPVVTEFGIKGEIVVVRLLCAIYREGYFAVWNDALRFKLAKSLYGRVSVTLLSDIVERLVKRGFFDKALFDTQHILTGRGIQKRYFQLIKKRSGAETYPYLLKSDAETRVSVPETRVSVPETRVSVTETRVSVTEIVSDDKKKRKRNEKESVPPHPLYKEKEKEKENEKSAVDIISAREADFLSTLRTNQTWIEPMCMRFKLSKEEMQQRIDQFALDCQCRGTTHESAQNAMRHFNDWLRINISAEQKQKTYERTTHQQIDATAARKAELRQYVTDAFTAADH